MAGELLLDTGALVSLLDRSQEHHEKCVHFFEEWERPVVSTEVVLTEATHLLGRSSRTEGLRGLLSRRWRRPRAHDGAVAAARA
jgi:predicted nucleic acid-binding protein